MKLVGYLLKKIIPLCLGTMLFFAIVLNLVDLFMHIANYLQNGCPAKSILIVMAYYVPKTVWYAAPVGILFSTSYVLSDMYANNELEALFASGVSLLRFTAPLLILSFGMSFALFWFENKYVVHTFEKKTQLQDELLNNSKSNQELSSRIENIVAKAIEVPENLTLAIDVSLAAANQNIIVNSSDDAKFLIRYLKDNKIGRVTFLPVESVKRHDLKDEYLDILSESGAIGIASKLIKYDSRYSNIFASLLGRTVIVDNLDNALSIAKKYNYEVKLVTLAGEIIATSGSLTGGFVKGTASNLINHTSEIELYSKKISELNG